jgi:catechol 2,3-dioxygenase-like lactoylglutathione lyase family enzyme
MLADSQAYAGFSTDDIDKAREFYGRTLGIRTSDGEMGILRLHLGGGGTVIIYPKQDHQPATYTVLNFPVPDIAATVDGLTAAGVTFERYPGFESDERGIVHPPKPEYGPPIAWFKDPAGNVISVLEETSGMG